jgi:integrase/recombinase XerD
MIRKRYRQKVVSRREVIEKETLDKIIFRTTKNRNRLLLELKARGGIRVSDLLILRL